jgi:hypothetical protein
MFRSRRPSSGHHQYMLKPLLHCHGYKHPLINTKMYIDLLTYLKITTSSTFIKELFNVCWNLKPIGFVSLHLFSSMEDKYVPQRGVLCWWLKLCNYIMGIMYCSIILILFMWTFTFRKSVRIFRLRCVRYTVLMCVASRICTLMPHDVVWACTDVSLWCRTYSSDCRFPLYVFVLLSICSVY